MSKGLREKWASRTDFKAWLHLRLLRLPCPGSWEVTDPLCDRDRIAARAMLKESRIATHHQAVLTQLLNCLVPVIQVLVHPIASAGEVL